MISILLLILKIIGIILIVLLGLLFLFLGIILFVPLRYEVQGRCNGTIDSLRVKGCAYWLLRLFRVDAYYKDYKFKVKLQIAWKTIIKGQQLKQTKSETTREKKEDEITEEELNDLLDQAIADKEVEEKKKESMISQEEDKVLAQMSLPEPEVEEIIEPKPRQEETTSSKTDNTPKRKTFSERITYTFEKLCDKIKMFLEKKNRMMQEITEETHIQAVLKGKKEGLRLLKRMKPKQCKVNIRYGFEDPKHTGELLALFSVLSPILGPDFCVFPEFQKEILKGDLYLKGKICVWYFVDTAIRLFISKNIRSTYKDIKSFEW